jgi:hypothetical protein
MGEKRKCLLTPVAEKVAKLKIWQQHRAATSLGFVERDRFAASEL